MVMVCVAQGGLEVLGSILNFLFFPFYIFFQFIIFSYL
jgi:hypothetical protein